MKNIRLSVAFLLLAVVLAVVPSVFAQEGMFGASAEDVALWTAANEGLSTTSASFNFTVSLAAIGLDESGEDVTAEITGSGAFDATDPENPLFQLDVTGMAGEDPVNLNVRIVDGIAYMNDGDGWQMQPLEDVVSEMSGEFGDLSGMTGMDPSSLSPDAAMSMFSGFEEFVSLERTEEDDLAKFTLSIDVPGVLTSPAIAGLLGGAMGGGEDMSEAQTAQMAQMMGMMFADASITFAEYIDEASETLSRAVFNIDFPLEAILGSPGAGVTLNVDASFSNYGEPVVVEAPEGAVEVSS